MAVREFVHGPRTRWIRRTSPGLYLFTDDCVIAHTQGTLSSKTASRSYYEPLFRDLRHSLHLWSNVVVHLADGLGEGRVTACIYALLEFPEPMPATSSGSTPPNRSR